MSPRASRRILWLSLALLAPLPVLLGVATGLMPVPRILLLAGASFGVVVLENANGAAPLLITLLLVQAALYLALLWVMAWLLARGLAGWLPGRVGLATGLLVLAGVAAAVGFDLYRTPFRRAGTHASLVEIFQ